MRRSPAGERGFTLVEALITVAILGVLVAVTASAWGLRTPRTHPAALALAAAVAEARALAATTAAMDASAPTGATVYVAPDPLDPASDDVSVYRSRPIALPGASPAPLLADVGFPRRRTGVAFTVTSAGDAHAAPFALLISSAGYASVVAPMTVDPGRVAIALASDPGCADDAVTIAAARDGIAESHAFACRDAAYDAAR